MLREQLRLRNGHIQQQRQELDEKVPGDLGEMSHVLQFFEDRGGFFPLRRGHGWSRMVRVAIS